MNIGGYTLVSVSVSISLALLWLDIFRLRKRIDELEERMKPKYFWRSQEDPRFGIRNPCRAFDKEREEQEMSDGLSNE